MKREHKYRARITGTDIFICGLPNGVYGNGWDFIHSESGESEYIDIDTLSESIGLLDIKLNDIYEGDIVIITGHGIRQPFEVRYFAPSFHILCVPTNVHIPMSINSEYEIIGNIYDNPELLVPKI